MTIIYADTRDHVLYVDTKISYNDGRTPESGLTKVRWIGGNAVAICGLTILASAITEAIAKHFDGAAITAANIKLDGFGAEEFADGFIMTPDHFWAVLFGHGIITIIRCTDDINHVAGSGSPWFHSYMAAGSSPEAAFDMVCNYHNECGYPVDQVVLVRETQNGESSDKLISFRHTRLPV